MKTAMMILAAAMIVSGAVPNQRVLVCLQPGPEPTVSHAAVKIASKMYRDIGVELEWYRNWQDCPADGIAITMPAHVNQNDHSGALADAQSFEGTHIRIFYDRAMATTQPVYRPTKLAHILVHELGHMLQCSDRHGWTGVMKATWNAEDYRRMWAKPLEFSRTDVELINAGIERRHRLSEPEKR